MALLREERKVLLNIHLKRIVDFHGHLCPELVLGWKHCEYAENLLTPGGAWSTGVSVIA